MEKRNREKKNKEKLPVFIIAFAGTILLTCGVIYLFKDATSLGGDFNAIMNIDMSAASISNKRVQCKVANCEKCSEDNYCSRCKSNYKVVNGKCVAVKNCYKYGSNIKHTYNAKGVLVSSTWTSNGKECITNLGKMTKSECDKKGGSFNSIYKGCTVNAGKCICYH